MCVFWNFYCAKEIEVLLAVLGQSGVLFELGAGDDCVHCLYLSYHVWKRSDDFLFDQAKTSKRADGKENDPDFVSAD